LEKAFIILRIFAIEKCIILKNYERVNKFLKIDKN